MIRTARFLLFSVIIILITACNGRSQQPFEETFVNAGTWSTGDDTYTSGQVQDGAYKLLVKGDDVSRWAAAGQQFGDGLFEVEAIQVAGPLDNGYGMLFRADPDKGDFYLFKISGDGYVWIGRYEDGAETAPIVGEHWFQSTAVNQGLNSSNKLGVRAHFGNLIFYVNEQEVGRVTDKRFSEGDIGLYAQTLGFGGVDVNFDNFTVTPLEE